MKKIALVVMAVALTFSAMAQTNEGGSIQSGSQHKGHHNGMNRGENFDKLNLTDAQKSQLKSINQNFKQQMQDLKKQGNITVNDQKQKREALVKEHREKISAMLTPEQRQQAGSMMQDWKDGRNGRGENRFENLTKALNLTPEQSTKMASLNSALKTNIEDIRKNDALSRDQKRDQMHKLMKQHKSDMEALLNNDQKEQLKSHQNNRGNRNAVK